MEEKKNMEKKDAEILQDEMDAGMEDLEDMDPIKNKENGENGKDKDMEDVKDRDQYGEAAAEAADGEDTGDGTGKTAGDASGADGADASSGEGEAEGDGPGQETDAGLKAGAGEDKKGFFKKKKKDKKDERIEELTDQVKRQMAEFDNFRKRTEKEKTQMYEVGAKGIIEKVLPVVDNFERGLAAVPQENKDDAFVDGMNKIYKQLMTMLEEAGVVPIEAVGKEFDPNLHNAVMQVESEEYESGIVAQELQKGYLYRDSVVRHSMVAVVN